MIYGGDEPVCCPQWIAAFSEKLERPCIRVDIDPSLYLEVEMLNFLRHPDLKPLALAKWNALTESLPADRKDAMLSRLAAVLSDPQIVARFHPSPELPEE